MSNAQTDTRTIELAHARVQAQPCLVVLNGEGKGKAFWLNSACVLIGRDAECEVRLTDNSVSRRHAQILATGQGYAIEDLSSKNGTFVEQVKLNERAALRDGDLLRAGQVSLQFFVVRAPGAETVASPRAGALALDAERQCALIEDRVVTLTGTEYQLLSALMQRPGRVLNTLALMRAAYPRDRVVHEATVTSHLRNLRRKLAEHNKGRDVLRSIYGRGYCVQLSLARD
jgi:pSer/pThr/pTyr-binding forkhead associated (FHA) protein